MLRIRFHLPDRPSIDVVAAPGQTLMRVAVDAGIREIAAECGGNMACATCHLYLSARDFSRVQAATADERDMLAFARTPLQETSRLSCQIDLTDELDGLEVTVPADSY